MSSFDYWRPRLIRFPYSSADIAGSIVTIATGCSFPFNVLYHGFALACKQTTRGTLATDSPTITFAVNVGTSVLQNSGALNVCNGMYVANNNADPDANGQFVWFPAVQGRRFAIVNGVFKDLGSGYWAGASNNIARFRPYSKGINSILTITQAAGGNKNGTIVAPSFYMLVTPLPIGMLHDLDSSTIARLDEEAAKELLGIGVLGNESLARTSV